MPTPSQEKALPSPELTEQQLDKLSTTVFDFAKADANQTNGNLHFETIILISPWRGYPNPAVRERVQGHIDAANIRYRKFAGDPSADLSSATEPGDYLAGVAHFLFLARNRKMAIPFNRELMQKRAGIEKLLQELNPEKYQQYLKWVQEDDVILDRELEDERRIEEAAKSQATAEPAKADATGSAPASPSQSVSFREPSDYARFGYTVDAILHQEDNPLLGKIFGAHGAYLEYGYPWVDKLPPGFGIVRVGEYSTLLYSNDDSKRLSRAEADSFDWGQRIKSDCLSLFTNAKDTSVDEARRQSIIKLAGLSFLKPDHPIFVQLRGKIPIEEKSLGAALIYLREYQKLSKLTEEDEREMFPAAKEHRRVLGTILSYLEIHQDEDFGLRNFLVSEMTNVDDIGSNDRLAIDKRDTFSLFAYLKNLEDIEKWRTGTVLDRMMKLLYGSANGD